MTISSCANTLNTEYTRSAGTNNTEPPAVSSLLRR